MAIEVVVEMVFVAIAAAVELLPEFDLDNIAASGGIVVGFTTVNNALPLVELVGLGVAALALKVYMFAWHGLVWVYDHIPFI